MSGILTFVAKNAQKVSVGVIPLGGGGGGPSLRIGASRGIPPLAYPHPRMLKTELADRKDAFSPTFAYVSYRNFYPSYDTYIVNFSAAAADSDQ